MFDTSVFAELPEDELFRIEKICEEFEVRLLHRRGVSIEEILEKETCSRVRSRLLRDLIEIEVENSEHNFSRSQYKKYLERFPDDIEVVEVLFERNDLTRVQDQQQRTVKFIQPSDSIEKLEPGQMVDKYSVIKCIGTGSFGVVYHALDTELQRDVALKIAIHDGNQLSDNYARSVSEARSSARIKANGIATIYDFHADDERVYIVQEYVEGKNLSQVIASQAMTVEQCAELVCRIAEAIAHAHEQNICHRDLKPNNIIVDTNGFPTVVDFGLALQGKSNHRLNGVFGTPSYMSPEQVRGDINRTDPASDVWSLGVVLFEMLVGERPFEAENEEQLFLNIQTEHPVDLTMIGRDVPSELNRIVSRCLAKKKKYRYPNASLLADDLRRFLDAEQAMIESDTAAIKPKAKGLRIYTREDSAFYLDLVSGYRDHQGIPESIVFWKNWVETAGIEEASPIGLIYGASGCGKSSFVQAGVLPMLGEQVVTLSIEATPDETEVRLFQALRSQFPGLSGETSLPDAFLQIRDDKLLRPGEKLLIVIDQFEQWMLENRDQQRLQLANALRHCDGKNLQVILVVSSDFWPEATQFMDDLEYSILYDQNCTRLELLDKVHAKNILEKFGRAYGRLANEVDQEQQFFLEQAIEEINQDGGVLCIRLALLAEAFRAKEWTLDSLAELDSFDDVGPYYLNEKFLAKEAPLENKAHAVAAQDCLMAMLPSGGVEIKGKMQTKAELIKASGFAKSEEKFDRLLEILDRELGLLKRTSPLQVVTEANDYADSEEHYQLSQDYLVPVLRNWIDCEQQRFFSGRLKNRMAQISAVWQEVPDGRYLPSWSENLQFHLFTNSKSWTTTQRAMMRASGKRHFAKSLTGFLVLIMLLAASVFSFREWSAVRKVETITAAQFQAVNAIIESYRPGKSQLIPKLHKQFGALLSRNPVDELEREDLDRQKFNIALSLAAYDSNNWEHVVDNLPVVPDDQIEMVAAILESHSEGEEMVDELEVYFEEKPVAETDTKLRRALLLGYMGKCDALINFLLDADAPTVRKFGPVLSHDSDAVQRLNKELAEARTQVYSLPSEELKWAFGLLDGIVEQSGAIIFNLPIAEADKLLKQCFDEGYVPVSYRPFLSENGKQLVAIAWSRDTNFLQEKYENCVAVKAGLTAKQLVEVQQTMEQENWRMVDVSWFENQSNDMSEDAYAGIWFRNDLGIKTRFNFNLEIDDYEEAAAANANLGFQVSRMFSTRGPNGEPRISALWDDTASIIVNDPAFFLPELKYLNEAQNDRASANIADCQIANIELEHAVLFETHIEAARVENLIINILADWELSVPRSQAQDFVYYALLMSQIGNDELALEIASRISSDLPDWKDIDFVCANVLSKTADTELFHREIERLSRMELTDGERELAIPIMQLRSAVSVGNESAATNYFELIHKSADRFEEIHQGKKAYVGQIDRSRILSNLILAKLFPTGNKRRNDLIDRAMDRLEGLYLKNYKFILFDSDFDIVRQDDRFLEFVYRKGFGQLIAKSWRKSPLRSKLSNFTTETQMQTSTRKMFADGFEPSSVSCRINKLTGAPSAWTVWKAQYESVNADENRLRLANAAYLLAELGNRDAYNDVAANHYGTELRDLLSHYVIKGGSGQ